jgi:hypothetical protein
LLLEALQAGIEITYIRFDGPTAAPGENTERLIAAIADARFAPFCYGRRRHERIHA